MRRPTPLPPSDPPPGGGNQPAAAPSPVLPEGGTVAPGDEREPLADPRVTQTPEPVDIGSTEPIDLKGRAGPAPIWGLTPGGATGRGEAHVGSERPGASTDAPAAGERLPAPGVEAAPEPDAVGVREVWRAARARRRALKSEVRRFTARARRRRAVWLGSIAAVVLVALGSVAAAYSPLFAVETITVAGAEQLDAAAVAEALSSQLGTPLPLVDESAIKAALVAFPLVESYTVEARPPHDLVVRVVERTPIGVIASPAGYTLVDAAGVALSTTQTPAPGRPVLEVTGGTASEAFAAVGHVLRSLPDTIMSQVTEASATTPNDVTLTLGGTGTQIVWGNADESSNKSLALAAAMQSRPPETVSRYDVSSPLAVVIQ